MDAGGVTDGMKERKRREHICRGRRGEGWPSDVRERVLGGERERVEGIAMRANGEGGDRESRQSHCDDRDAPTSRGAICPLVTSKNLIVIIVSDVFREHLRSITPSNLTSDKMS